MDLTCDNPLCGQLFETKEGPAHLRRSKRHYCSRRCQNTTHGLDGTARHKMWESAKRRAKRDRTTFALRLEDIPSMPDVCPVLGIALLSNRVAGPIDSSPSLDRVIASRGYVPGNVRIISFRANRLRSDATASELRAVAEDAERLPLA